MSAKSQAVRTKDTSLIPAHPHTPTPTPDLLPTTELSLSEACAFLELSPEELAAAQEQGLVACSIRGARQIYPRQSLELSARLLALRERYGWWPATVAWYADLAFASEVGRVVLLPLADPASPPADSQAGSWLGSLYASAVLRDLEEQEQSLEERMMGLARSLLGAAFGPGLFWETEESLKASALSPILAHLERHGSLVRTDSAGARSGSGELFVLLVLTFATLASPISGELRQIVQETYAKLRGRPDAAVPIEEQERILKEQLIAVDRLYASKATEIHAPPDSYEVNMGMLSIPRRTVALQLRVPLEDTEAALDNILDIIRPYLGTYGARVVQALYEIANDPPYWRSPVITIETNILMDRLGEKRDSRSIHYSRNRARLRDTLNAAHNLEIVGEYTTWEEGRQVRKAIRRPVISLIGATFDSDETAGLTTEELFQKGLPKTMQVRLNFYDGIRRPDGTLGNRYVLMPRLGEPAVLPKANYAGTHERLRHYLLFRYRQERRADTTLILSRSTAMEKAGITNKNVTRATQTLEKALRRLVDEGTLKSFTPVPLRPLETFNCVLSEGAAGELDG